MDRLFEYILIRRAATWCGFLLLGCGPLLAQDPESPPAPSPPPELPHANPDAAPRPFHGPPGPPPDPLTPQEHARLKEALEKLPPDIRALLDRNRRRFHQMPEERREILKNYAMEARERMRWELDRIVEENASALSEPDRGRFRQRYIEERRALEKSLREKMDQERAAALPALLERLRSEFGMATTPSPPPKPIGWGCGELHPAALPHHRTCGFPHPAVEPGKGQPFSAAASAKSHGRINPC